jgi:branched-chain amino acid transport system ATP-binding protein
MSALLSVEGLRAGYGSADMLFGIDLHVDTGEVVALVGRNGAGKSTTLKAIMGLVPPRAGRVVFAGTEISGLPAYRIARRGLGYVPEDRRIFTNLSVAENLDMGRQQARPGRYAWTPERLFEIFPNLGEMRSRRALHMSGGEQQMLSIARTLMGNPLVVLLDEPTEGIAPVIVDQMVEAIRRMKEEGIAILLCEQNVVFASAVSERLYAMQGGEIQFEGRSDALADPDSPIHRQMAL